MILKRLRDETSAHHRAIERQMPVLNPGLTRDDYKNLIQRFYGYYAPLEARLLAAPWWPEIDFHYGERRKSPALEQDLVALGLKLDELPRLARCDNLPPLTTLAQALGCLYVIEGSTLGGQVIARHLQTTLGLDSQSGVAFFSGYGEETRARWQAFGAMLQSVVEQEGGDDEIVAGANRTFETLARWLFPAEKGA